VGTRRRRGYSGLHTRVVHPSALRRRLASGHHRAPRAGAVCRLSPSRRGAGMAGEAVCPPLVAAFGGVVGRHTRSRGSRPWPRHVLGRADTDAPVRPPEHAFAGVGGDVARHRSRPWHPSTGPKPGTRSLTYLGRPFASRCELRKLKPSAPTPNNNVCRLRRFHFPPLPRRRRQWISPQIFPLLSRFPL
jgi:hypothetical protein